MAKVKKAWFIGTDGERYRLPQFEGREVPLREMYPIIGNGCSIVQLVVLKKGVDMWCDEEGLLKASFEENGEASELYRKALNRPDLGPEWSTIVGNAIVIDNTKAGDFFK